jgi:hypothetical protein
VAEAISRLPRRRESVPARIGSIEVGHGAYDVDEDVLVGHAAILLAGPQGHGRPRRAAHLLTADLDLGRRSGAAAGA